MEICKFRVIQNEIENYQSGFFVVCRDKHLHFVSMQPK